MNPQTRRVDERSHTVLERPVQLAINKIFPQDIDRPVDVGVNQQTFLRLVQSPIFPSARELVVRLVVRRISGYVVQVKATGLRGVTLLDRKELDAVELALRAQLPQ